MALKTASTLNDFRDVIGLLTCLLDSGCVAGMTRRCSSGGILANGGPSFSIMANRRPKRM